MAPFGADLGGATALVATLCQRLSSLAAIDACVAVARVDPLDRGLVGVQNAGASCIGRET